MKKTVFWLFFFLICALYGAIFRLDTSVIPLGDNNSLPTWARDKQVILVSYGDGPDVFKKNQNVLAHSATSRGVDVILSYKKQHLDPAFCAKNKAILDQKRGAGFWVWKPYVILKAMEQFPLDSIIIYADSGVIFAEHLYPLLSHFESHDMILAGFTQMVPLVRHIKREALRELNIPENNSILHEPHFWGAFIVFRNSEKNKDFVRKWLAMCENSAALTDTPFDQKFQLPEFGAHEHDQSLLSILVAKENPKYIKFSRKELMNDYGITNYHRHPAQESASPLLLLAGFPKWASTLLYDNPIINWIRFSLMGRTPNALRP